MGRSILRISARADCNSSGIVTRFVAGETTDDGVAALAAEPFLARRNPSTAR